MKNVFGGIQISNFNIRHRRRQEHMRYCKITDVYFSSSKTLIRHVLLFDYFLVLIPTPSAPTANKKARCSCSAEISRASLS